MALEIRQVATLLFLSSPIICEVFFEENFDDSSWRKRWITTSQRYYNGKPFGSFNWTASSYDANDKGIMTTDDNSYYAISTMIPKFSNRGKSLVIQFTVKFQSKNTEDYDAKYCAAAFLKLFPPNHDPKKLNGDSPYLVRFGPDTCPTANRIQADIFYKNKMWIHNPRDYDKKIYVYTPMPFIPNDSHTHLYQLVFHPNSTYEKRVDGKLIVEESGHMEHGWQTHPPRRLRKDQPKPSEEEWDEREYIFDPEDKKPADWDVPEYIPDPYAEKPSDWDEEADGPWEHPIITNPAFHGSWKPRTIKNPKCKGVWEAEEYDNPDYKEDPDLYVIPEVGAVGFENWQETSGVVYDNIMITDDLEYATSVALPIQQKAFDTEYKRFAQKCEEDQKRRLAERKKIESDHKRLNVIAAASNPNKHDEL